MLSYAYRTPAYFRPFRCRTQLAAILPFDFDFGGRPATLIKLITDYGKDKVLPYSISGPFLEANYPFSTR